MAKNMAFIFTDPPQMSILLRQLKSEYLWNETRYRRSKMALKTTNGHLQCPIISWTIVHKYQKIGSEILPTPYILHSASLLHWRSAKRTQDKFCQTVGGKSC